MTSPAQFRRPAAFRPDDPNVVLGPAPIEAAPPPPPRVARAAAPAPAMTVEAVTEPEIEPSSVRRRSRAPWALVFWASVAGLVALATGLSIVSLLSDLFDRADALGYLGLAFATLASIAAAAILAREARALLRLKSIDALRDRASETLVSDDRKAARTIVLELTALTRQTPELARARERMRFHVGEIIDGRDLLHIAEREMMRPLDDEARRQVGNAAKRVSVVTAVSPRAAVDILFVLVNAVALVRRLSLLYGGRPGTLGMIRLMRHVVAHLAMTGGLAMTDGLVQQVIGHGLAAKLSAKLGEGVLNGLLTARLGLAAIDVTRPLPFSALRRPNIQDLAGDLLRPADRGEGVPAGASAARAGAHD
jgi:putative membrane protein